MTQTKKNTPKKNKKKRSKPQSLLLEQRGAALSLSDMLHTSSHTSPISHIYIAYPDGGGGGLPQSVFIYIYIYIYIGITKKVKKE